MATLQVCKRSRGQLKCCFHPNSDIFTKCQECDLLICHECVLDNIHQGHTFIKLVDCYKQAKENIEKYTWNLENTLLPKIGKEIEYFNSSFETKEHAYSDKKDYAEYLRKKFVEDINSLFSTYTSLIEQDFEESRKSTENHINLLESQKREVLHQIEHHKSVLKTATELEIHDDEVELKDQPEIKIPGQQTGVSNIPYIQISDVKNLIDIAVGLLQDLKFKPNPTELSEASAYQSDITSASLLCEQDKTDCDTKQSLCEPNNFGCDKEQLTYQPLRVKTNFQFRNRKYWKQFCPISKHFAWVIKHIEKSLFGSDTYSMCMITVEGTCKHNIKVDGEVQSLTIDPWSSDLYGWFSDNTIRQIDTLTGTSSLMFKTSCRLPTYTMCVTITRDGHFLAAECLSDKILNNFESNEFLIKVVVYKYTMKGEPVSSYVQQHRHICDIGACPLTYHTVLACNDGLIVVLDKSFQELFTYGTPSTKALSCSSVFDPHGNVIVARSDCSDIHIVGGKRGQCLQVFNLESMTSPRQIKLCSNVLWVKCENKIMCIELTS